MSDTRQDEPDMTLSALLNDESLDRPLPSALRERVRQLGARHFGAVHPGQLLPEGTLLGSYRVERVLGAGGQAVVYQARHQRLPARLVALKVPHGDPVRMLREADTMARLVHPGVVEILDVDAEAQPPYLVLEYCAGGSLAERLEDGLLSEDEVLRITRALLEALAFAHEREVVHRDLKPENVLFDGNGTPRIADFGLGKIVAEQVSLSLSQGTHTGIAGTPLYMAPEQERPGAQVDGRTDLYAVGKLIYRMLTGEHPRTLRPIEQVRKDLHHPWSDLVFRLTESFPQARPASAREVLAELDRWQTPGVLRRAEAQLGTLARGWVEDPSLRAKLREMGELLLSNPTLLLGAVLAVIGAVGMTLGQGEGLIPLSLGAALVWTQRADERRRGAPQPAVLAVAPPSGPPPAASRGLGQVLAICLSWLCGVLAFFTALGATIAAYLGGHSPWAEPEMGGAAAVAAIVAGFLGLACVILYGVSIPSEPRLPPPPPRRALPGDDAA